MFPIQESNPGLHNLRELLAEHITSHEYVKYSRSEILLLEMDVEARTCPRYNASQFLPAVSQRVFPFLFSQFGTGWVND